MRMIHDGERYEFGFKNASVDEMRNICISSNIDFLDACFEECPFKKGEGNVEAK